MSQIRANRKIRKYVQIRIIWVNLAEIAIPFIYIRYAMYIIYVYILKS